MASEKNLSWYPGHMKQALDKIRDVLPVVDIIIEIADARAPISSINHMLDSIAQSKKRVLLFSKKDLADNAKLTVILNDYKAKGIKCLALDFKSKKDIAYLTTFLEGIKTDKAIKYERFKLQPPPTRALIVGIPNVGKSTLINSIAGKNKVSVANKPGHTRTQQLIKLSDKIELIDTPGVLQPNYLDKNVVIHLSWIGSVKDDAIDIQTIYNTLSVFLIENYLNDVKTRYQIGEDVVLNSENFYQEIAKARNFVLKQGVYDIERAESTLLKEFRSGFVGKVVVDELA